MDDFAPTRPEHLLERLRLGLRVAWLVDTHAAVDRLTRGLRNAAGRQRGEVILLAGSEQYRNAAGGSLQLLTPHTAAQLRGTPLVIVDDSGRPWASRFIAENRGTGEVIRIRRGT